MAKIFGRSVNTKTNKAKTVGDVRSERQNDAAAADKVPGSFVPGDQADVRVKWQEKIFGPEDIVTLSSAQRSGDRKLQHHRTVAPPNNPLSRLEVRRGRKLRSDVRCIKSPLDCVFSGVFWKRGGTSLRSWAKYPTTAADVKTNK